LARRQRVAGTLAEELDQVGGGETTFATPPHTARRQEAGVAPAPNRRLADPKEPGRFFSIQQTITYHCSNSLPVQYCTSLWNTIKRD
jgi:hypothetical protein